MPLMARREAREVNPPAGRAATMAAAREALRPPMCLRRLVEAVLRSTPTWHTADCTTCAGGSGGGASRGTARGSGDWAGRVGGLEARLCQLSIEQLGRQVMLVQPHSEGFRIDSDELRHGVL